MRLWQRLILPALMLLCGSARADLNLSVFHVGADGAIQAITAPISTRLADPLTIRAVVDYSPADAALALTQSWIKVSGPGDATFAATSTLDTNVSFSEPGDYVLSITATAGAVSRSAEIHVTVSRRPPAGRYRGLLVAGDVPVGTITAKITSTGAVTAVLQIGRRTFRFRPNLNVKGIWRGRIGDSNVTLRTNAAGTNLSGVVNRSGIINRATLAKIGMPEGGVPNAANGGKHTFLLTAPESSQDVGHGYGLLKIRSSGAIALVGKTPDGLPFSVGSSVRPSGVFDFYVPLHGQTDFLGGTLRFVDEERAKTDIGGFLVWRASQPVLQTLLLTFAGSGLQSHPSYLEPWTGSNTATNARFSSGGQGRAVATQAVTIQTGGQGIMASPTTLSLSLRIYNSGLFFGTFRIPGRRDKSDFTGVILQRTQTGGGLLLGSSTRGWVELEQVSGNAPDAN